MDRPPAPRADVYRAHADVPRSPLGRGAEAVHDPLRRRIDLLSPTEAVVFAACRAWGTAAGLAARVAASGAGATPAAALAVVTDLVARGVLLSETELAALLAAAPPEQGPPPRIAVLGIPTRDRPESLRRALESHARDLAERGRHNDVDLLVLDDSAHPDRAALGSAHARDVAQLTGVRVRHAGRSHSARFAAEIAAAARLPLDLVRGALVPDHGTDFAAGAVRNLLLLDSAGQCSLQVDDDTLCDPRQAPAARDRLAVKCFEDPTEFWFTPGSAAPVASDPAAMATPRVAGAGYVDLHERLLGRSAAALLVRALSDGTAELDAASTSVLARIAAGARVASTQLGVRGDSALGTMGSLLELAEPSRGRLLASERTYRDAVTARRLERAVTSNVITEQEQCMTFAIGLDGRAALPPFPPLDRNEDGLFGTVLAACDPGALFGHLPWTVAHEPEEVRVTAFDVVFDEAGRVGVNDLLAGLVSASRGDVDRRSPAAAFETLGRSLVAWSAVPADELFERIAWMLARRLAQRLARLDALLRASRRQPPFWARDAARLMDTLRERIEEPERAVPYELRGRLALAQARTRAMERARAYGELLIAWPAMLDAAVTLRERGVRLGEEAA